MTKRTHRGKEGWTKRRVTALLERLDGLMESDRFNREALSDLADALRESARERRAETSSSGQQLTQEDLDREVIFCVKCGNTHRVASHEGGAPTPELG